jgi:hypothetical protein
MGVMAQLKRIFERDGFDHQCSGGQFWFVSRCGPFDATFRIYENGFITVLIGTLQFPIPTARRAAVAEFCSYANYALLAYGDLEIDPEDGSVAFRHSLFVPNSASIEDEQLRWFVGSSAMVLGNMSRPIATVATTNVDVLELVNLTRELMYPGISSTCPREVPCVHVEPGEA